MHPLRLLIRALGIVVAGGIAWRAIDEFQDGLNDLFLWSLVAIASILIIPWKQISSSFVLACLILTMIASGLILAYFILGGLMWAGMHGASQSLTLLVVKIVVLVANLGVLIRDFVISLRRTD